MIYSFHGLYKVKENLMEIYRIMIKWWEVWHIMGVAKAKEHPYTSPDHIVNDELTYNV